MKPSVLALATPPRRDREPRPDPKEEVGREGAFARVLEDVRRDRQPRDEEAPSSDGVAESPWVAAPLDDPAPLAEKPTTFEPGAASVSDPSDSPDPSSLSAPSVTAQHPANAAEQAIVAAPPSTATPGASAEVPPAPASTELIAAHTPDPAHAASDVPGGATSDPAAMSGVEHPDSAPETLGAPQAAPDSSEPTPTPSIGADPTSATEHAETAEATAAPNPASSSPESEASAAPIPSPATSPDAATPAVQAPALPTVTEPAQTPIESAPPPRAPHPDAVAAADRVREALDRLRPVPSGGAEVQLELESLGRVHLRVEAVDGGLRLSLATETPAAAAQLESVREDLLRLLEDGQTSASFDDRRRDPSSSAPPQRPEHDAGTKPARPRARPSRNQTALVDEMA